MMITPIHLDQFPWYDYKRYSFSLGLKTPAGTYLSGHTASEYEPASRRIVVRGGMSEQVRTVYTKVAAILEAGGLDRGDVVRVVEYVQTGALDHYAEAAAVRCELFERHRPVVNIVPVKSLLRSDAFMEIEVTAAAATGLPAGAVFLPTIQPIDDLGNIVGAGNVSAQLHAIYDTAAKMLSKLGLGLEHLVKTATYVAPSALGDCGDMIRVRSERLGPVFPAAVDIVMPRLLHPQALVQCDFIATREVPEAVNPGWSWYDGQACSPAVRAGKLLYISAQGARDVANGRVLFKGDVVAQAEYIYGNVLKIVEAAGGDPRHLVKTVEYVTPASLARYREVTGVRSRLLQEPLPASTGLISEALLDPEMLIEVDCLAVLD
jgi:Putative translation initiation inhibitor, yjgF family